MYNFSVVIPKIEFAKVVVEYGTQRMSVWEGA